MKNLTYAKFQKYSNLNILIDLFHFWKLSLLIAATGRPLANSNLNPRHRAICKARPERGKSSCHPLPLEYQRFKSCTTDKKGQKVPFSYKMPRVIPSFLTNTSTQMFLNLHTLMFVTTQFCPSFIDATESPLIYKMSFFINYLMNNDFGSIIW